MKRKLNSAPVLEHKSLEVSGVKILNDTEGIVEAFVAGIGNKDSGKDIIQPGAFVDSLQKRNPKCCWSHDWQQTVGKVMDIYEVSPGDPRLPEKLQSAGIGGLYAKVAFNLNTTRGRDAYEDVKFFGDEGEWSIGYAPTVQNYSKELDANLLHKIDLFEISPVAFGMNPLTSTVSVKTEIDGDDLTVKILGVDDAETSAKIAEAVKSIINGEEGSEVESGTTEPEAPTGAKEVEGSTETKEELETEVKTVRGSYEDQQEHLREALKDTYPYGCYVWVRATFDSNVVYQVDSYGYAAVEGASESETDPNEKFEGTWAVSYQTDDGKYTFGTPVAVELSEIVVAKYALAQAISKGHSAEADLMVKSISIEIDEKVGRVLSKANRDKVQAAKDALDLVLSADTSTDSTEEKIVTPEVEAKVEGTEDTEEKGIVVHSTKTSDDAWSGTTQWAHLPQEATALKEATAWVDPEGDIDKKASYKLIHHFVEEDGTVGAASVKACSTGIALLATGRVDVSDDDKKGVFEHLVKHLTDAGIDESADLKVQIEALAKELGVEIVVPEVKAYEVRKSGDEYCVFKQGTDEQVSGGCHSTRTDAVTHMRALYANVDDAKTSETVEAVENKSDDIPDEELPIDVTLDEVIDNIEEKTEVHSEETEPEVHEFKALDEDNASVKGMPCGECGEVEASDLHVKQPELVELNSLDIANIELLLAG